MIIDFRLHTSDNALTENGVQIAVYSMLLLFPSPRSIPACRHFHVITFHINVFIAIVVFDNGNAFIISFLCVHAAVAATANSFRKLCKHFPDATLIDNDATC